VSAPVWPRPPVLYGPTYTCTTVRCVCVGPGADSGRVSAPAGHELPEPTRARCSEHGDG